MEKLQWKAKLPAGKGMLFKLLGLLLVILIVVGIAAQVFLKTSGAAASSAQVISVSTLEEIIDLRELSTFTAVYNGIAQVMNEKDTSETDYYVSYEARVNAGIDFDRIAISIDEEEKTIHITLPEVYITEINVDIGSLDFIFFNQDANTSTVTQEAFQACEADVQAECEQQDAILELAQQNAVNVVTALTHPIVEQLDAEYSLVVE